MPRSRSSPGGRDSQADTAAALASNGERDLAGLRDAALIALTCPIVCCGPIFRRVRRGGVIGEAPLREVRENQRHECLTLGRRTGSASGPKRGRPERDFGPSR